MILKVNARDAKLHLSKRLKRITKLKSIKTNHVLSNYRKNTTNVT